MTLLENTIRQGAAPPHRNELNELAHVARLALMNEMVCGLAHELKQPLAAIANYACAGRYTALAANSSLHPSVVPLFDRIAEQAERAGKIVGCLRDFVSRHDGPRAVVDLNELVRHAMVLLEVDARVHDVSLALCLDARSCLVEVDRIQIEQVVVNLVKNAWKPPPKCHRHAVG